MVQVLENFGNDVIGVHWIEWFASCPDSEITFTPAPVSQRQIPSISLLNQRYQEKPSYLWTVPVTEQAECEAFFPVVGVGIPHPLTRRRVCTPPPWLRGGGALEDMYGTLWSPYKKSMFLNTRRE